jgi:hypothetical protein
MKTVIEICSFGAKLFVNRCVNRARHRKETKGYTTIFAISETAHLLLYAFSLRLSFSLRLISLPLWDKSGEREYISKQ